MNTVKEKKNFPFQVRRPSEMSAMEQIACMIYLAGSNTLEELRKKQDLIEQQIVSAYRQRHPLDCLHAMQDNIAAAVAYQQFEDTSWMAFIREKSCNQNT